MSDTLASLRRKIVSAGDLQSVVRTMKAMAAMNIGQYEQSVKALTNYFHTVELGLGAYFRSYGSAVPPLSEEEPVAAVEVVAVVFGSDQGLVGQFNDVVAEYAILALAALPGKPRVWAVGERVHGRLTDGGLTPAGLFGVPLSIKAVAPLIGQILSASVTRENQDAAIELHLFYNRPSSWAEYAPVSQRLLPLDESWRARLAAQPWPTKNLSEVTGEASGTLRALVREYLFVSLFRACAESLACENASRLAAMERADKNIDDILEELHALLHGLRQSGIDEELFDVVAGFEALAEPSRG